MPGLLGCIDMTTLFARASPLPRRRVRARAALAAAATLALLLSLAGASAAAAHAPPAVAAALQEESKLTSEPGSTATAFGFSVAVSGDGNTALVGTRRTHSAAGAVWVFVRSDGVWTQQGPALVGGEEAEGSEGGGCASPEAEGPECSFGRSVALSADGDTALIGGANDDGGRGAAWVFTRKGSTWSQQGGELLGGEELGDGHFGRSVALSGDGSTALIGGAAAPQTRGAAWVFTRSGSSWEQQGPPLGGGSGHFGRSVALSGDGDTALVGSPGDGEGEGALWFFTRNGSTWLQDGAPAAAAEEDGAAGLGSSVALSADGTLALAGGSGDDEGLGAAWSFSRTPAGFAQQGPKLTGAGETGAAEFGYSVALAGDGAEALIGAPASDRREGAAVSFARTGSGWSEAGPLSVSGEIGKGSFGKSVALSSDGATAIVGGTSDNVLEGAAWTFFDPALVPPSEEPPLGKGVTPPLLSGETGPGGVFVATGELASTETEPPLPKLGVLGNLDPVAGVVRVKLPGSKRFVDITGLRQVPFGTIVDVRHGRVTVTTMSLGGQLQAMAFYQGEFSLTQNAGGTVLATLVGGSFKGCPRVHAHGHLAHASSAKKHVVRKLWASGHGSYTTKGNYASGAVLGTRWLTEDRCDGTLIRVYTDEVEVTNLLTHKRRTVKAGHSELVKAP